MRRLAFVLGPGLALWCALLPSAGQAGPPEDGPPEDAAPVVPAEPAPVAPAPVAPAPVAPAPVAPAPVVPDSGTMSQVQGPGTQSQVSPSGLPPGGPGMGPTIQVNPQIQVQVQPTIDARAEPKAEAGADAKADAKADAAPKADANSDVSTQVDSAHERANPGAVVVTRPRESETTPGVPAPGVSSQRRIRVVMRSDGHHHHDVVHPHRQRGRFLLTAGIVSFGAGYATAAINGGWLYDQCETDECKVVARDLFIPVAGPFMAMQHVHARDAQIKLGVVGGAQSLGVFLGLVGAGVAIHDARARKRIDEHGVRVSKHMHVSPTASVDGAGLTLRARF